MLRIPLSVSASGFTVGFLLMGLRGLQRLVFPAPPHKPSENI
jgi:hypothetical protein